MYPTEPSTRDSDRYMTPRWVLDLVDLVWLLGIDCDPFHDPASHVRARHVIDCREGGNAYTDPIPGITTFLNGPYSGKFPGSTARLAAMLRAHGHEVLNLCPAAPGSEYWRRFVWPNATAIVWLGRLAFEAAVDIYANDGRLVCKAGKALNGNRTEIAMPYLGDDPERVRRVFCSRAEVTVL